MSSHSSDDNAPDAKNAKGFDRRSLLIGGGIGAAGAVGIAAAGSAIREAASPLLAPSAVRPGDPAKIALSYANSHPALGPDRPAPPRDAPNIVVIILDDVGFADLGCYGGDIETPHIDRLAAEGLRYANFRTTAMCSCTRASLLTGLNHHSAGMGWLADIDSGFPGYRGDLTLEAATLAEVLRDAGWSTFLVGKWHVNNVVHNGPTGPFHNWPTHRGFERAYWYQGHSTDYFRPGALYDGVTPVEAPARADYYVTDDLADRAIRFIRTQKASAPTQPFFLQLAFSGAHSPLQAKAEDRDHYRGRFDKGWDQVRRERLARQKAMGLVAETAELPPLSFGADPWDTLTPQQKRLYARYMEVYAGVIHALDRAIGRLMDELQALGVADNTLVMLFSDNGGSPEGTPTGTPNILASALSGGVPLDEADKLYDVMGGPDTFPHYPMGWANASNTPFRLYKQYTNLGGVADPLVVHWPKRIADKGAVRRQFVHVVDLFPTVLEAAGVKRPDYYRGLPQKPLEGASAFATFNASAAPTRTEQYYELGGFRAYQDGKWRLVAVHRRGEHFEKDHWALYDLEKDPTELHDLSDRHPDVAAALLRKWDAAAVRYSVLPLDDRNLVLKMMQQRLRTLKPHWEFRPPVDVIPTDVAPLVCGQDHDIEVEFERPRGVLNGVLVSHGSTPAGYSLFLQDGRLIYETSLVPWRERIDGGPVPEGRVKVTYRQKMKLRPVEGSGALYVNGEKRAEHSFRKMLVTPSYDGFAIGSDPGGQVSKAYAGPNPWPAPIHRVVINIHSGPPSPQETLHFIEMMKINA
jgi:arylsulfatase A-like enzyme